MEFDDGVKITDAAAIERLGIDPADVAKILVVAFSEMLLNHGVFHADPHPGNLLVGAGPRLIFVDFGQVKEIGPAFRFVFAQMTRALIGGNIARHLSAKYGGGAVPVPVHDSYAQILRILRANPLVRIPPDLLFVGRVMGLLNGLSMTLQSRTNLLVEMSRLLDRADGAAPAAAETTTSHRRLLDA